MSYDLFIFKTPPGRDVDEVFDEEMSLEEEGMEANDDADLIACHAAVEKALGGSASCSRAAGHVAINIPYHYQGAEAQRLFGALAECLRRTGARGGLTVYDPQEGRAIDPQRDLQAMLAGNERGTKIVRDIQPGPMPPSTPTSASTPQKKPWWRFW